MAAFDVAAKREGHKAMERKITPAGLVRRAFKAGPSRRKDLALSPDRAVVEAWALCNELQSDMRRVGLPVEDVQAALVLLTGNLAVEQLETIHVYPVPDMAGLPLLYRKVKELQGRGMEEMNIFALGVVFKQYDHRTDPESMEVWAQPWLVFPNARRALQAVEQRYANLGPGEEIFFHQSK